MSPPAAKEPGCVFAITGVSGSGKSTLCHRLAELGRGSFSISHTTRPPGPAEQDGVDYFFVSQAKFEQLLATDQMLEHAQVHGHLYGTSRAMLEDAQRDRRTLLLEIDVQGVMQVRGKVANLHTIFILPPSFEILEQRLHKRQREGADDIVRRLRHGLNELTQIKAFDYLLVNDDFEKVLADALLIVDSHAAGPKPSAALEALRTRNQGATTAQWLGEVADRLKSLHG